MAQGECEVASKEVSARIGFPEMLKDKPVKAGVICLEIDGAIDSTYSSSSSSASLGK